MKTRLHIVPVAGLANRLRLVLSAIALAEDYDLRLCMTWSANDPHMGACFSDLFENQIDFPPARIDEDVRRRFEHVKVIDIQTLVDSGVEQIDIRSCHPLGAHTGLRPDRRGFWNRLRNAAGQLHPRTDLKRRIDCLIRHIDHNTVGVHMRSGAGSIAFHDDVYFRLDDYAAHIARLIRENPQANFYVACDAQAPLDLLRQKFGDRIITLEDQHTGPVERQQDSIEAVRDALVDLYCLAATQAIVGTHRSSFSEVASAIGGLPLCRLGDARVASEQIHRYRSVISVDDPGNRVAFIPDKAVVDTARGEITLRHRGNQILRLNPCGLLACQYFDGARSIDQVIDILDARFDTPREAITQDIFDLVEDLYFRGAVSL